MNALISLGVFIIGAALGSFLQVINTRLQKNERGIIKGRSHCDHCKKTLQTFDLIPIVSYLFLQGKCRYCQKKIPFENFAAELLFALTLLGFFWKNEVIQESVGGDLIWNGLHLLNFIAYGIESFLLLLIFFYDLKLKKIPDIYLYLLVAASFIFGITTHQHSLVDLLIACVISLTVFGGQILVSKGKWLGEGDLYIALALGFIFGWQLLCVSIILTYFIGSLISILLLAGKLVKPGDQIPFAPFLVMGFWGTAFFGEQLLHWYVSHLLI